MRIKWFCTNLKTARLRHDYGLGLLDDENEAVFEAHLMDCDYCHRKLSRSMAFSYFVQANKEAFTLDPAMVLESRPPLWNRLFTWNRQLVLTVACFLVITAPIALVSYVSSIQQDRYGLLLPGIDQIKTIGEQNPVFHSAVLAFQKNEFETALKHFNVYLRESPENFDANFLSGLCYLELSKKGIAGATFKLDRSLAQKGIQQLEHANRIALDLQSKTGNNRYYADSIYYLGKAHYIMGEINQTRQYYRSYLAVDEPVLPHREEVKKFLDSLP